MKTLNLFSGKRILVTRDIPLLSVLISRLDFVCNSYSVIQGYEMRDTVKAGGIRTLDMRISIMKISHKST